MAALGILAIRRDAVPAWEALQTALSQSPNVPCIGRDEWTSETAADLEYAAGHCRGCPALTACLAFALANREPRGIWGGVNMGDRAAVRQAINNQKGQPA